MNQKQFMFTQYLAALNNEHPFTAETHAMREGALEALPALMDSEPELFQFNNTSLEQLMTAYFLCTYCHTPNKHKIKKSINRLLRDNMISHGIFDAEPPANPPKLPPR